MVNPPNFQSLQDYIKKKSIFFQKIFTKSIKYTVRKC